jgi:hypothetical protein
LSQEYIMGSLILLLVVSYSAGSGDAGARFEKPRFRELMGLSRYDKR